MPLPDAPANAHDNVSAEPRWAARPPLQLAYLRGYGLSYPADKAFVPGDFRTAPSAGVAAWKALLAAVMRAARGQERERRTSTGVVVLDPSERVLVLNAGLWDAAYGELAAVSAAIGPFLRAARVEAARAGFGRLVWLTTTDVHPEVYGRLRLDRKKQFFTAPRVHALNNMARAAMAAMPHRGPAPFGTQVRLSILDAWQISQARDDDPLTPTDMRHYGASTTHAIAQELLRTVCGDDFLAAEESK